MLVCFAMPQHVDMVHGACWFDCLQAIKRLLRLKQRMRLA